MKTMSFTSSREFRAWLAKNHGRSEGIWLRICKKDSGEAAVTYAKLSIKLSAMDGSTDRNSPATNDLGCKDSRRGGRKADGPRTTLSTPNGSSSPVK
jgi:hypothetical protein